ncbi:Bug family tripartite tricarboxylate transporter substrate binding protein [Tepidicella baoligensis]|uniref:Bug family tripartite tricarboxylate transporter substrate binding protein n=1 Tax=Tepidicella baoligensis TaxID=2707016 RepID=UPI0015DA78E8|nr:tripartite tricarboxylate transporter substrate binding protein [Tepidicella baoligensis]
MNPTSIRRRTVIQGAALTLMGGSVWAQSGNTLRFIVPFPAGGTADILPRIVAEKIRAHYAGGVVVDNRPGAGGNIGAERVFRSEPDGLTVLASPPGPIAVNHHLYSKLSFDPTQWVPVTVLATAPNILGVSNKLPVKNLQELIAYLKANPGKVSVASQGNGSTSHLTAALFMQLTGTEMIHIPYRGTAPALVDLIAGNVDVFFDNISSSAPHHNSNSIRIFAVAGEKRSKILPDIPTFAEQGLPNMQAVTFFSVVAPPGTPAAAAARLQSQIAEALSSPEVRQRFEEQGTEPAGWSPERTGQFIRAESEKWKKVIQTAKVTLE